MPRHTAQDRRSGSSGSARGRASAGAKTGLNAGQLTKSITECDTVASLMQLVELYGGSFNPIHATAALTQAAKLMQPRLPLTEEAAACVGRLLVAAEPRLSDCDSRSLATMAWALAKLGYQDPAFMQQLLQAAKEQAQEFTSHQTANMLWAMAKLGCEDKVITQQLLARERDNLKQPDANFTPQVIANTLWAMAKLQHVAEDRTLLKQLLAYAQPQLEDFLGHNLAHTAWALATLRHHDSSFMQQLLQQARGKLSWLRCQDLTNLLWAMARLRCNDAGVVDGVVNRLLLLDPKDRSRQALCSAAWALSMLQHSAAPVAGLFIETIMSAFPSADLSAGNPSNDRPSVQQQLRQVHQYLVAIEGLDHISNQLQASAQYQQLRTACQAAFLRQADRHSASPVPVEEAARKLAMARSGNAAAAQLTGGQGLDEDAGVALP